MVGLKDDDELDESSDCDESSFNIELEVDVGGISVSCRETSHAWMS